VKPSPAEDSAPVAVVIVGWNSIRFLPACLESLRKLRRPPAEIVLVDAGSSDGSLELVTREFPEVRIVDCKENVGFCRGNNIGIRQTQSPFVLALNPDTMLDEGFLEELLPAFEKQSVGMAAGKLLRFDKITLDSAGQCLSRARRPQDRGYGLPDEGQYERDEELFGVCGAAALYRRQMLDEIADPGPQYFDERFFSFGEDLDIAWRAQRFGWRAAYRHKAVGYHARGGSATRAPRLRKKIALLGRSPEIRFHAVKNRYLSILRNDTPGGYLANLPFILMRDISVAVLLTFTSPSVFLRLWQARALFRGALERRRLDARRIGNKVKPGRGNLTARDKSDGRL